MPGVPQGQLSQLGKHKLVSELHSWHGNYQKPDVLDFFFVQARKEILDLESDICRRTDVSFHVVPYKLKVGDTCRRILFKPIVPQFDPESLHMCTKLSGQAAQFSKRKKFDSIVRFLSARCRTLSF